MIHLRRDSITHQLRGLPERRSGRFVGPTSETPRAIPTTPAGPASAPLADRMQEGRLGIANLMEGIDPRSVAVVHLPEKSMHIHEKPHEPSRLPRRTVPRNHCSNSTYTASKRGPLPLTLSEKLKSWAFQPLDSLRGRLHVSSRVRQARP